MFWVFGKVFLRAHQVGLHQAGSIDRRGSNNDIAPSVRASTVPSESSARPHPCFVRPMGSRLSSPCERSKRRSDPGAPELRTVSFPALAFLEARNRHWSNGEDTGQLRGSSKNCYVVTGKLAPRRKGKSAQV